jgi:hypothetical protein
MRSVKAVIHVIKTKGRIILPITIIGYIPIGVGVNRDVINVIVLGYHGAVMRIHVIPTSRKVLDRCLRYLEAIVPPTKIEITTKIRLNNPFKNSIIVNPLGDVSFFLIN